MIQASNNIMIIDNVVIIICKFSSMSNLMFNPSLRPQFKTVFYIQLSVDVNKNVCIFLTQYVNL